MKNFGITKAHYDKLYQQQGGLCAICRVPESFIAKGGILAELSVDHNHMTKEVRGLLCHTCNSGIGMLRDDPDILRAAIAYLEAA